MRIKFWGVRGSIPTPERRNSRYGGNTTCIEVRLSNGSLIILDCGSGLRSLGRSLVRENGDRPIHADIFLTHFHWDHIQGLPFCLPFYNERNEFSFYAVGRKEKDLKAALEGQMTNPYFPADMSMLRSARHFYDLSFDPIEIHGAVVCSAPLNHPQEAVAYRIEADGMIFVLATDTEPGSAFHDRALRELAQGADLLVYDAQYTPEQLSGSRKGWGHSSWMEGARIANECGIKQLVLFHHDPDHADIFVDDLVEKARREFPNTTGAAEGLELLLSKSSMENGRIAMPSERRGESRYRFQLPIQIVWHTPGGTIVNADGTSLDISKSGMYFVSSTRVPAGQCVAVTAVLPDEITRSGDLPLRFDAELLRQEEVIHRVVASGIKGRGVAARLIPGGIVKGKNSVPFAAQNRRAGSR